MATHKNNIGNILLMQTDNKFTKQFFEKIGRKGNGTGKALADQTCP